MGASLHKTTVWGERAAPALFAWGPSRSSPNLRRNGISSCAGWEPAPGVTGRAEFEKHPEIPFTVSSGESKNLNRE